ncbi:phosphatidylinositol transfer protein 3 isoform X1 [Capsicum galapagoense]
MSTGPTKSMSNGFENSLRPEEKQTKQIDEMRKLIGPLSGKLALYCFDASISRYLTARSWNVKKAAKMLKTTLKWRFDYKPEEIRWDDVAIEAETGKIYRSNYKDKYGRPVLVMRPRCQNTKSIKGQIKYLVYCMENAVINLPEDQEQMVWLIDFHGFNLSHISVKVTKETAHVLQDHYPERLGIAILYDAPKIFEPFWKIAKPFLDPKTASKVKFMYSDDPNSKKMMEELFDMSLVESAFGGNDEAEFDVNKYAERMREDDKKLSSFWKIKDDNSASSAQPTLTADPSLESTNSDSDSEVIDEKAEKPFS